MPERQARHELIALDSAVHPVGPETPATTGMRCSRVDAPAQREPASGSLRKE
jgi:hypothetical protein